MRQRSRDENTQFRRRRARERERASVEASSLLFINQASKECEKCERREEIMKEKKTRRAHVVDKRERVL
jgi:hypothetical protein